MESTKYQIKVMLKVGVVIIYKLGISKKSIVASCVALNCSNRIEFSSASKVKQRNS